MACYTLRMHLRLIPTFTPQSLRPGRCSLSGNAQRHSVEGDHTSELEPVLDLDTLIDTERGNLEITLQTAREIASHVGYEPPERLAEARDRISVLEDLLDQATDALETKTAACSALASEVHAAGKALSEAKVEAELAWAKGYEQGCADYAATPELDEPATSFPQ